MTTSAVFSEDGVFRYELTRTWDAGAPCHPLYLPCSLTPLPWPFVAVPS